MSWEDQEKEKQRVYYLNRRKKLLKEEVSLRSLKIIGNLKETSEFQYATTIHCYVSIDKQKEVDTKNLIEMMLESGKRVVVPKIAKYNQLKHVQIHSLNELKVNKWGVAEPLNSNDFNIELLDLVLVPMVAGDRDRNRLGYGKGFYDRFLEKVRAVKIGLLYDFQIHSGKLVTETHDVALDLLITETERI